MPAVSLVNQIKSTFIKNFSSENYLVINSPGRINLIGEHTDYNHGLVLPGAIDKSIVFGIGKSNAGGIHVHSVHNESISIHSDKNQSEVNSNWGHYFESMVEEIRDRKLDLGGVNCVFGGDIPIGSGLSSSAALCCGFLFGLNALFKWNLSLFELAKIAQAAEHRIGANVGLMDQFAVMHGEKDKVIYLDCLDYSYKYFPLTLQDHVLVLINSNVKHEIATSAYNERRQSCERVLERLRKGNSQVRTLRDISIEDLKALNMDDTQDVKRVAFVLDENERVRQTTHALSKGDMSRVGELLFESHEGLCKEFMVSCPELDMLVDLARKEMAVTGARMMGGGFGGCTINLIHSQEADQVVSRIKQRYLEETQIMPESYEVSVKKGVHIMEQL